MDTSGLFRCLLLAAICWSLPTTIDSQEGYCTRMVSISRVTYVRVTRQQIVVTYYRCWLFYTCTTYKTATAYSTEARTQTTYALQPICCLGFEWDGKLCVRVETPQGDGNTTDSSTATTTPQPEQRSGNRTVTSARMDNMTANEFSTQLAIQSSLTPVSRGLKLTSPTTETTGSAVKPSILSIGSSEIPTGAKVLFGALAGLVVVACIIVIACLRRRRRRKQLKQRDIDSNDVPLGDLQLISSRAAEIQHVTPSFAPDDEYALEDKGPEKKGEPASNSLDVIPVYENSIIQDNGMSKADIESTESKEAPVKTLVIKEKPPKETGLIHTYIDCPQCPLEPKKKHTWTIERTHDTCYTDIDDTHYNASDEDKPQAKQIVYEAIQEKEELLTYDHLDRDKHTQGVSNEQAEDLEENTDVAGRYGVLVQSASIDNEEDYDMFHRKAGHIPDQPSDHMYGSIDDHSTNGDQHAAIQGDVLPGTVPVAYDDIMHGVPVSTSRKGSALRAFLKSGRLRAGVSLLGSSMESDPGDQLQGSADDHIYRNTGDLSRGISTSDRDSVYTDMSGPTSSYTPMAPCPEDGGFFNTIMDVEECPTAEANENQYSSILESKEDAYDHVERKLDGGRLDVS